ncbi:MAG: cupin domain-containing protein [Ignavibacteria bacterium]|nr:cupin domain-containing protein [Ignavibacteria bacterium]
MSKIKVEKLTEQDIQRLGIKNWPIWEKEISTFDWFYDETEQCFFLEGKVIVQTDEGEVEIGKGDFVTFPSGLSCVWKILEPVRKHYRFI